MTDTSPSTLVHTCNGDDLDKILCDACIESARIDADYERQRKSGDRNARDYVKYDELAHDHERSMNRIGLFQSNADYFRNMDDMRNGGA